MTETFRAENLSLNAGVAVAPHHASLALGEDARRYMISTQRHVDRIAAGSHPVYGINTGFGALATIRIPPQELSKAQHALLRSHAAGMGEFLEPEIVRAIMAIRTKTLASGYSGVRPELLEAFNRPAGISRTTSAGAGLRRR